MLRSPRREEPENRERWLVSYADFVTLLFAFFVVMFASSQTDKGRAKQISESVKKALQQGSSSSSVAALARVLGGTADDIGQGNAMMRGPGGAKPQPVEDQSPVVDLLPALSTLSEKLASEIEDGKLEVNLQPRGLVISLRQAAFFPSGEDVVDAGNLPTFEKVADVLASVSNPVRLEGHTDSLPIRNGRFQSNWQLSSARSIAMLELLTEHFELPENRFAVVGYADTAPMDSNDSPEGRSRNRRVDIVILSQKGMAPESVAGGNQGVSKKGTRNSAVPDDK